MAKISLLLIYFPILLSMIINLKPSLEAKQLGHECSTTTFFSNSKYQTNLNTLFYYLTSNATNRYGYHYATAGVGTNDVVYGNFLCRGDESKSSCQDCVKEATVTDLANIYVCPNRIAATIWYDKCMVRYSNESFFGIRADDLGWGESNQQNVTGNVSQFMHKTKALLKNITSEAARGGSNIKYATGAVEYSSSKMVYGLVQCTPDLNYYDCRKCLVDVISTFPICKRAQYYQSNCNARFDTRQFFSGRVNVTGKVPRLPPLSPQLPQQPTIYRTKTVLPPSLYMTEIVLPPQPQPTMNRTEVVIPPQPQPTMNRTEVVIPPQPQPTMNRTEVVIPPQPQPTMNRTEMVIPPEPQPTRNKTDTGAGKVPPSLPPQPPPAKNMTETGPGTMIISSSGKSKTSTIKVIAIAVVLALIGAGLLAITFYFIIRRCKSKKIDDDTHETEDLVTRESLLYTMETLQTATNGFSNENKLGQGGFGTVYKGTLPNGEEVAVKRMSRISRQGAQEFKNEILLVAKLRHKNLARLLGFALNQKEKLLVYEYLPNKSLDHFVFDPIKQGQLNWRLRYDIIQGIAKGMLYLHQDSGLKIIHRDLKASNILLDAKMNPKIADFGLARLFGYDKSQSDTSRIAGTRGYMSPEYAMHGIYSTKSDVYSYGILILEIISGKINSAFPEASNGESLVIYARKLWEEGKSLEFADASIRESCSSHEVTRCVHLGLLCVQKEVEARPTMATVVLTLESNTVTLPVPGQPGFFDKAIEDSNIIGNGIVIVHSSNDVSVSEIEPR
ncbi:cysteine-rich receptor-like protein kinase 15 [Silene latifolia]|uniref:cysteine-rich receptor-like protein kinase 15 n=1 Tax=Silene latifolia TaxID=37657 RepID=UPI003D7777F7